ncbi:YlbD family protein [Heyndrickxia sp. FSL W8-0496]|uniref:YlbD family protein n=1 Tax=Heyndrickxia TaxID=2837504 RepID=UPI0030F55CCE
MGNSKLHPSVEKFKAFVKTHPKIIQDVRNGNHTLQELYEEWYLLGEEDPYWEKFQSEGNETLDSTANKKDTKSGGWMNQIGNIIQKVDANQMQNHLNNLSQVIASVQGVLSQFQGQNSSVNTTQNTTQNPFSFRKD